MITFPLPLPVSVISGSDLPYRLSFLSNSIDWFPAFLLLREREREMFFYILTLTALAGKRRGKTTKGGREKVWLEKRRTLVLSRRVLAFSAHSYFRTRSAHFLAGGQATPPSGSHPKGPLLAERERAKTGKGVKKRERVRVREGVRRRRSASLRPLRLSPLYLSHRDEPQREIREPRRIDLIWAPIANYQPSVGLSHFMELRTGS